MPRSSRRPRSAAGVLSARALAVDQLNRIEVGKAYVGLPDDDAADDPRAGRQATEYVAGITRWRRYLDFLLASFYRGAYVDMEPTLRQILRVGLYDLLFLHTPSHAALNEAVDLAKTLVRPGAGGLVNGILRAVQRRRDDLPEPSSDDPAERLAVLHSHPTWMVRRWLDRYGADETQALLEANNRRPVFGVRIGSVAQPPAAVLEALREAGGEWEPSPYLDDFVRMQRLQPLRASGLLQRGAAAVQDEAAGLVVRLLDPRPGETVMDTCAAPGGKALYAATRMDDRGRVVAYDAHPGRLGLVARAAEAQGLTSVRTHAGDLRALAAAPDAPSADRVLVDAPCSGLGVLAKRADLRWQRAPRDLDELAALQDELLDAAGGLVRPGGLLVYSTCSIEPEENEQRVAAFLARHADFTAESAQGFVPDDLVTPDGHYATLPHRHGVDGAFGARLRRQG